jgi:hypothetical protein
VFRLRRSADRWDAGLTTTARDGAGNRASSAAVTVHVRDVVSPDVILVTPAWCRVSEPNVQIVVRFSEAVDRSSVTSASIRLTTNSVAVPVTIGFTDGDQTVTLTPVSLLKLNTNYSIDATTQIRDVNGNALFARAPRCSDQVSGRSHRECWRSPGQ